MEENQNIPYIVLENANARWERLVKKIIIGWLITIILAVAALFFLDFGWRKYLSESEIETCIVSTDSGGNANYIGQDGDICNGKDSGAEDKA